MPQLNGDWILSWVFRLLALASGLVFWLLIAKDIDFFLQQDARGEYSYTRWSYFYLACGLAPLFVSLLALFQPGCATIVFAVTGVLALYLGASVAGTDMRETGWFGLVPAGLAFTADWFAVRRERRAKQDRFLVPVHGRMATFGWEMFGWRSRTARRAEAAAVTKQKAIRERREEAERRERSQERARQWEQMVRQFERDYGYSPRSAYPHLPWPVRRAMGDEI